MSPVAFECFIVCFVQLCKASLVPIIWPSSRVVPEAYMKYAINLIEYFQDQH